MPPCGWMAASVGAASWAGVAQWVFASSHTSMVSPTCACVVLYESFTVSTIVADGLPVIEAPGHGFTDIVPPLLIPEVAVGCEPSPPPPTLVVVTPHPASASAPSRQTAPTTSSTVERIRGLVACRGDGSDRYEREVRCITQLL